MNKLFFGLLFFSSLVHSNLAYADFDDCDCFAPGWVGECTAQIESVGVSKSIFSVKTNHDGCVRVDWFADTNPAVTFSNIGKAREDLSPAKPKKIEILACHICRDKRTKETKKRLAYLAEDLFEEEIRNHDFNPDVIGQTLAGLVANSSGTNMFSTLISIAAQVPGNDQLNSMANNVIDINSQINPNTGIPPGQSSSEMSGNGKPECNGWKERIEAKYLPQINQLQSQMGSSVQDKLKLMCNLGAINEQAAQEYLQYVNTCRASESAKAARDLTEAKKYRIDTCSKR